MVLPRSAAQLGPSAPTVRDLLAAGHQSFSFEFFPPRDDEGEEVLWNSIRRLEGLSPTFVSVTYGAGGSTRDRTARITRRIATETSLTPVAHLTCVQATRTEIRQVVAQHADNGVRNILALRGDPPGGPGTPWEPTEGGLRYAVELVELLKQLGDFSIGVAASPHRHAESPDLEQDARVLAAKVAAGADYAITDMFFELDRYVELVERAARHGVDVPIIPGLMPLTNQGQIERFRLLSGAAVPARLVDRLMRHADDRAAFRAAGMEAATTLAADLLAAGAPGLHFYTLNRSTVTSEIYRTLQLGPGVPVGSAPAGADR
jgi:methylenetetrahydrofolate reductase (NADPH)